MVKPPDDYQQNQEKGWRYVGRFMCVFASAEGTINELFVQLFNLENFALLFLGNIDLRKKLDLIAVGLRDQGVDGSKLVGEMHKFHDIRNAIAHSWFESFEDVVVFDWVNKRGRLVLPSKQKSRSESDFTPSDREIAYSKFDEYDQEMTKLITDLGDIAERIAPITDSAAIEKAIREAENVVRFPGTLDESKP